MRLYPLKDMKSYMHYDGTVSYHDLCQRIINAMKEEYTKVHNTDFTGTDADILSYCEDFCYVAFVDNDRSKAHVGHLSISRFDLNNDNYILRMLSGLQSILFGYTYIYDVFIYPEYRDQGFGQMMVEQAINISRLLYGSKAVFLHVRTPDMIDFYSKNGFLPHYNYKNDNRLILLCRTLT